MNALITLIILLVTIIFIIIIISIIIINVVVIIVKIIFRFDLCAQLALTRRLRCSNCKPKMIF